VNILVTGGAGYIGSHTCISLLNEGHSVIIADNFVNSKPETIQKIMDISSEEIIVYEVDITDEEAVDNMFRDNNIDGVIHFAGLKAVGESVEKPYEYYYNNIVSTLILANACKNYNVNRFVFSSSATVYGDNTVPFVE